MSRAQRLLDLIQILRSHRFPVTGAQLAQELDISVRTLYRDIGTLQAQGANIEGEAGLGYVLRPGFMLPPLMFSEQEIEALVLGSRWVASRGDARLGKAARSALSKIAAVLPAELRDELDTSGLLIGPGDKREEASFDLAECRRAIRGERKVELWYRDFKGDETVRTVWPFALGYFDHAHVLVTWCELRAEYRHFRTDRIAAMTLTDRRYPRRRQALLQEWRDHKGIPPQ